MCDLFLAHTSMPTFVCVFRHIATFLHGHPSTSGGYERARWSPVCRLRRVVFPRSPVHLRQIRESSLEPSVVSPWSPIHLRRIRESWSPVQPATKQHLPVTGEDGIFRNHPVYLAHYVAMLLSVWFMSCSNLVYDRNSGRHVKVYNTT